MLTAWLRHQYIRTGETLFTQSGDDLKTRDRVTVKVEGWGRYAPVKRSDGGYIRRDVIKWVPHPLMGTGGYWFYRYDP